MPETNTVTETDIIAYQARKLAELEREINELKQQKAILEATNEIMAEALSRALGDRDRVYVPRKRDGRVEYRREQTIGGDLLLIRL